MEYEILSPVNDWIFKLLFGDERHKSMLISLLKGLVDLPDEECDIIFLDTHLKPETDDDKWGILDVKVRTKSGKIYDIEIQVNPVQDIGKRLSFYKSKLIVEQIGEGQYYNVIQNVICICITDYPLFPKVADYLNHFQFYNKKNNFCFENIPEEIYTVELPKVPAQSDGTSGWEWLQFLRAKQKEEFEMVAARNPDIRQAVNTLYELSADEKVRAEYEMRLKGWRDKMFFLDDARTKGKAEGKAEGKLEIARKMKTLGDSAERIQTITGLSAEEISRL